MHQNKTHPVKLLLKLLVCIVYTELFETVPLKSLKPAPQRYDLGKYSEDAQLESYTAGKRTKPTLLAYP